MAVTEVRTRTYGRLKALRDLLRAPINIDGPRSRCDGRRCRVVVVFTADNRARQ